MAAARGRGDAVHLALEHEGGAASSATVSLTSGAQVTELLLWRSGGAVRMPDDVDVSAAYAAAIDALLGREVVRILAQAESGLEPARAGDRQA